MSAKRRKTVRDESSRPRETVTPPAGGPRWLPLAIAAGLVVLTVMVFAGVRNHDFVDFDDGLYITDNANVRGGLTRENVAWAFTTGHAANWHPLTWISHQTDVSMFGLNPGMHHLTNLFWHTLNVLLLFGLLRSLTGSTMRSAFVAGLFAIHPVHVESVAWISERKDVLSTFFWLSSTWLYASWTRRPSAALRLIGSLVLFAFGLMSKPMLMTMPFTLLLLDLWPLGRTVSWTRRVVEKLPYFALAIASLIVTVAVQQHGGAVSSLQTLTIGERFANAVMSYGIYLWQLVWPTRLAAFYPFENTIAPARVAISAALLLIITVLAFRLRRRYPHALVGWLWFVGTLVPVIGIVQVGMQAHADRYTYVPYIGLFVAWVWSAPAIARRIGLSCRATDAVGAALLLPLLWLTHQQAGTWRTSETLWTHAITVNPDNAKAHNSLGAIYGNTGRVHEAEVQFKEALRLQPDLREGLHIYPNLGRALLAQGKVVEAVPYLERARQLKPDDADLAQEMGLAYLGADRPPDAIRAFRDAVRLNPQLEQSWFVLGVALAASGRIADARHAFNEVLRINPGREDAAIALQRLR